MDVFGEKFLTKVQRCVWYGWESSRRYSTTDWLVNSPRTNRIVVKRSAVRLRSALFNGARTLAVDENAHTHFHENKGETKWKKNWKIKSEMSRRIRKENGSKLDGALVELRRDWHSARSKLQGEILRNKLIVINKVRTVSFKFHRWSE